MPTTVSRRCEACWQMKDASEFTSHVYVERGKRKRQRNPYCKECVANGRALRARQIDRATAKGPPDR